MVGFKSGEVSDGSAQALNLLFEDEYVAMVRLAFTLVGNNSEAEDLVQDSFVEVARRLDEIRQPGAYLRSAVEIADQASPSSAAWGAIQARLVDEVDQPMELTMLEKNPDQLTGHRPLRLALLGAAAVVVVVLGLVFLLPSDDGEVETDTADVVTTLPEEDPVQDEAQALATAERFVTALADLDAGIALEILIEEPAVLSVEVASDRESLARLLQLHAVIGRETNFEGCTFREPDQVACDVQWTDAYFAAGDFAPVESTYFLAIDGDEVVAVRWNLSDAIGPPITQFSDWLRENHPGELQEMVVEEFGSIAGMRLTDRSLELFELRIPEYLVAFDEE